MKKYHLYVQKLRCVKKIDAHNKHEAISTVRREEQLTWFDSVVCIGINL